MQHFVDAVAWIQKSQMAALRGNDVVTGDQLSNAGRAIHVDNARKIQQDVFLSRFDQAADRVPYDSRAITDGEPAAQVDNRHIAGLTNIHAATHIPYDMLSETQKARQPCATIPLAKCYKS